MNKQKLKEILEILPNDFAFSTVIEEDLSVSKSKNIKINEIKDIKNLQADIYHFVKTHNAREIAEFFTFFINDTRSQAYYMINEYLSAFKKLSSFYELLSNPRKSKKSYSKIISRILSIDSSLKTKMIIFQSLCEQDTDYPFLDKIKILEKVLCYNYFFLWEKPWENKEFWEKFETSIKYAYAHTPAVPEIFFENLNILQNCKCGLFDWQGYEYTMRTYKAHCKKTFKKPKILRKTRSNQPQLALTFSQPDTRALPFELANITLCYAKLDIPSCKNLLAMMVAAAHGEKNAPQSLELQANKKTIALANGELKLYANAHISAFGAFIYRFYKLRGMSELEFIIRFKNALLR